MSNDYRLNIKYEGNDYQLDLTQELPGKPGIVL